MHHKLNLQGIHSTSIFSPTSSCISKYHNNKFPWHYFPKRIDRHHIVPAVCVFYLLVSLLRWLHKLRNRPQYHATARSLPGLLLAASSISTEKDNCAQNRNFRSLNMFYGTATKNWTGCHNYAPNWSRMQQNV